jgi:anti-anti-sigma regulatory factor
VSGAAVVSVTGEIDAGTEQEFSDGLTAVLLQGPLRLVIDLARAGRPAARGGEYRR